jgi:pimeloyl-ACP methyl ester carboxylesterase
MQQWQTTYGIIATSTPYDWRLSFDDIIHNGRQLPDGHISYIAPPRAGEDPYILKTLKSLASTSKTGKVTIIAHSMGGLIAKKLMVDLGPTTTAQYIDKVILVDSPQVGTPKAVGALLHGYDLSIFQAISSAKSHDLSQNFPSAYTLLPSAEYFHYTTDPVITFDPLVNTNPPLPSWLQTYGNITSVTQLDSFMNGSLRSGPATTSDLVTPSVTNKLLFDSAMTEHQTLDAWTPPAGVQLFTIAGWGNETLKSIHYSPEYSCVQVVQGHCILLLATTTQITYTPVTTVDGDGTVVTSSQLWSNGATSTRYWVDLQKYNNDHYIANAFGWLDYGHSDIGEIPQLRTLLANILNDGTNASIPNQYISMTQPPYSGMSPRLHFTLHSPLTLGFIDSNGNYTGSTATDTLFTIPGVEYERYGEVQWLSVPASMAGQVVMHGISTGSFTLDIENQSGNIITATTSFAGIPSSTSTSATVSINPSISATASSTLQVDYDGNGTVDSTIKSKEGSTVLPDTVPPEIQLSFSTTTNSIQITATDDVTVSPTIISTTIYPTIKKKDDDKKYTATTTITAKDEAGNITTLVYTSPYPTPTQRYSITPVSINYNGIMSSITGTSLSYKWRLNKDSTYKLFASYFKTLTSTTEFHYRSKKNTTLIMIKPVDLNDDDSDDDADTRAQKIALPGLVLPYLKTQSGQIISKY